MAPQASGRRKTGTVLRRQVFFIAAFDPAHPRRYHRIFTEESAKQAALTGVRIDVGPLEERQAPVCSWHVVAERAGQTVEIDYQCLLWNDIVQRRWPKVGPRFVLNVWMAFLIYWQRGVLSLPSRAVRFTACAPVLALTVFLLAYAAVVATLCWVAATMAEAAGWDSRIGAAPLLLWFGVFRVWRRWRSLHPISVLGRGMIHVSSAVRGPDAEIEERLRVFAKCLVEAAREPGSDEILIVGHSLGAVLAVRALGQAAQLDAAFGKSGTPVSLLTLGQLIPFISLMTDDPAYGRDLKAAIEARQVPWVDVTGHFDPGAACGVHPLAGLGIEPPPDRPIRRIPRFHVLLTRATYRRRRRALFALHFQYLMATELAGGYDYFAITTGPRRLMEAGDATGAVLAP